MKKHTRNSQRGMVLMFALVILAVGTLIMGALAIRVVNHSNHVENFVDFKEAYNGLETAMARSLEELALAEDGNVGITGWTDYDNLPTFDSVEVTPLTLPDTQIEYFAYVRNWSNDGVDNTGNGTVDGSTEANTLSIHAFSRVNGVTRRAFGIFGVSGGTSIWDNAIFGGPGKRDQQQTVFYMTQGNDTVEIHGPVHILGDDLNTNDTALNLTKNSYIKNNYDGVPDKIKGNIPALELNDDGKATLDATLRVKKGKVHISNGGQTRVGQGDTGNATKDTIDGIYTTGFTGNDADGDAIFSDNGHLEPYETDLGTVAEFPTYDDDGGSDHLAKYLEDFGTTYAISDGVDLKSGENYYWNANRHSRGNPVKGKDLGDGNPGDSDYMPDYADLPALLPSGSNEFFVWWDYDNEQMVINGRIAIDGDMSTETGEIYYHGKGSFLTYTKDDYTGSAQIDISSALIPRTITDFNNNDPQWVEGQFLTENLIGLMSSSKITFDLDDGAGAVHLYGAFYCQDLVEMESQPSIVTFVGGVASDRFKVKGDAKFVFAPGLDDHWTDDMTMIGAGLPGGYENVAWVEIGIE